MSTVGGPSQSKEELLMERDHWAENLGTGQLEHIVTSLWYTTLQPINLAASLCILSLRHVIP